MKTVPSFVIKAAKAVSVMGHPLLTFPLFLSYVACQQWPAKNAAIMLGLVVGGVVLPISGHNFQKVKQGRYTNFYVSNQAQRTRFYPLLLGLLALVTLILFAAGQPRPFCYGMLCVLGHFVALYALNPYLKVSVHASLSFLLVWLIYLFNPWWGLVMGVFSLLIAGSRLVLKRHILLEIIAGILIGSATGSLLIQIIS